MKNKKSIGFWIILFIIIAVVLVIVGRISSGGNGDKYAKLSTREVALLCTTDMATQFHIHPELKIIANGNEVQIPADIGIKLSCMNSLHTHSADGIIHIESPVQRDFTLGDFFAVWDKTFTRDQILDYKVDQSSKIIMTVNDTSVDTYENTIMKDKDKIIIDYEKI